MPDINTSVTTSPFGSVRMGGMRVCLPPQDGAGLLAAEGLLVKRSDHLGLPLTQKRALLESVLPTGTDRFVGLFARPPNRQGVGGVELTAAGYGRATAFQWTTEVVGSSARRVSAQTIPFPVFQSAATAVAWGIWDSATGGNLLAFGFTRNGDHPRTFQIAAGDEPQFSAGDLSVGLS